MRDGMVIYDSEMDRFNDQVGQEIWLLIFEMSPYLTWAAIIYAIMALIVMVSNILYGCIRNKDYPGLKDPATIGAFWLPLALHYGFKTKAWKKIWKG